MPRTMGSFMWLREWFHSYVKCSHAEGERVAAEVGKAGGAHAFEECIALRKFADACRQIFVGIGAAGDNFSDPWQHVAEVPAVDALKRLPCRRGKLEHGDAAARRGDARHLGEPA